MAAPAARQDQARSGLAVATFNDKVYVVGGHNGTNPLKMMEVFTPTETGGKWEALPGMLARRAYLSLAVIDGCLLASGGSSDGRTLNTVEVFDPSREAWVLWFATPPMHTKRTLHASSVVNGKLYVCGGFDGIRDLRSVECWNPAAGSWRSVGDMCCGRSYLAVTAAGGDIYAIGGQDRNNEEGPRALDTVEVFEAYSERWIPVAPLSTGRLGLAAATLKVADKECVLAIGGSNGEDVIATVECYDLEEKVWKELPPMSAPRLGHAAAVIKNRLYVFGGFDGSKPMDTYECYDPQEEKWSGPIPMGQQPPS